MTMYDHRWVALCAARFLIRRGPSPLPTGRFYINGKLFGWLWCCENAGAEHWFTFREMENFKRARYAVVADSIYVLVDGKYLMKIQLL